MRNEYQRAERERIEDICYRELLRSDKDLSYRQMITLASKMADDIEKL